jgi:NADH-quinone oxidoreductase subunit N
MLFFLLSLAGIPPFAGFWGKYFIFLSLIETGHYVLASVAVLYAVIALYYYMRIANAMFMKQSAAPEPVFLAPGMVAALAVTGVGTVVIGMFPNAFIQFVNWSLSAAGNVSSIAQAVR